MNRHDNSSILLGNKILSRKHQEVSLETSADVDKFAAVVHSTVEDVKAKPDAFMTHVSVLKSNEKRAAELPPISQSAKYYTGDGPKLTLLFHFEEKFHLVLYDISSEQIENASRNEILNLLSCKKGQEAVPASFVNAKLVEHEAIKAANASVAKLKKEADEENPCTRVCAVYLTPESSQEKNMQKMFHDRERVPKQLSS